MRSWILFGCLCLALGLFFTSISLVWAADPPSEFECQVLVLYFHNNTAKLDAGGKKSLHEWVGRNKPGAQDLVFVLGHTDGRGDRHKNLALSTRRAQAVARVLTKELGLAPRTIVAAGKGPDNPAADNAREAGRRKNRRVEIYLTRGKSTDQTPELEPKARKEIEALVGQAREMVRHRQLQQALQVLQAARIRGGENLAAWHAVYGMAGFYGGVEPANTQAHFVAALHLDPLNADALEYASRLEARENVSLGRITPENGRTPQAPIAVSALAQIYEYLQLFNVRAESHTRLPGNAIQAWRGRNSAGMPVCYYFDPSRMYAWAFVPQPHDTAQAD